MNSIFTDVVLSLADTLGLHIVASLIFVCRVFTFSLCFSFYSWLMVIQVRTVVSITSFLQYLLMAPSYIAVLDVYAVLFHSPCAQPTKGTSLPVCMGNEGRQQDQYLSRCCPQGENKNEVDVAVPTAEADTNAAYTRSLIEGTENGVEARSCDGARRLLRDF